MCLGTEKLVRNTEQKYEENNIKKGKAIPVTGCGGPQGCEMSSLPHLLDNQLTDDSEVVSLMHQLPFPPRKIFGTHFC
jgi:hypothetical protein